MSFNKVFANADEAVADIQIGIFLLSLTRSGCPLCHIAPPLSTIARSEDNHVIQQSVCECRRGGRRYSDRHLLTFTNSIRLSSLPHRPSAEYNRPFGR